MLAVALSWLRKCSVCVCVAECGKAWNPCPVYIAGRPGRAVSCGGSSPFGGRETRVGADASNRQQPRLLHIPLPRGAANALVDPSIRAPQYRSLNGFGRHASHACVVCVCYRIVFVRRGGLSIRFRPAGQDAIKSCKAFCLTRPGCWLGTYALARKNHACI